MSLIRARINWNFCLRRIAWPTIVSLVIFPLSGCGGGGDSGGNSAAPPTRTAAETIRAMEAAGQLPVLDRTATVTGIDGNGNGVRDDIDAYIAALPDTATQKSSLAQMAKSIDSTMTADVSNDASLRAAAAALSDAVNCIWSRYDPAAAGAKVEEIRKIMVNTRPRYDVYARYNQARSGAVVSIPAGDTCR